MLTATILIVVGLIGVTGLAQYGNKKYIVFHTKDPIILRKEITQDIQHNGAGESYARFTAYLNKQPGEKHLPIHIFGEMLYRQRGIDGIGICDAQFGFGCFHGLFSQAVSTHGLSIVKLLDDACVSKYGVEGLGCTHGIGHGLGEYLGAQKLSEQLQICSQLNWQGKYFGCQDGVFMEYHAPTVIKSGEAFTETIPFDEHNPYDPCPNVLSTFASACYFQLPAWWWDALDHDTHTIGKLCDAVQQEDYRISCFYGLGAAVTPRLTYDITATEKMCGLMPDDSGKQACIIGAAWSFFALPEYRNQADSVCARLAGNNKEFCKKQYVLLSQGE